MNNDAVFAFPIVVTTIGEPYCCHNNRGTPFVVTTIGEPLLLTVARYLEANVNKGGFPFNCEDQTDNNTLVIVYFT